MSCSQPIFTSATKPTVSSCCELSCGSSDKRVRVPGTWGCSLIWKETLAGCEAKVEVFGLEMLLYGKKYFEAYRRIMPGEDRWIEEA